VVEAWVKTCSGNTGIVVCVNRTAITGDVQAARDKRDIDAYGCGLARSIAQASKDVQFSIRVNITAPYMPITSDRQGAGFGAVCRRNGKGGVEGCAPGIPGNS